MKLTLHLKPARDIPIIRGHPWILSGAIARTEGDLACDEAEIVAANGRCLGCATVHPQSSIRARLFSNRPGVQLNAETIRARLAAAIERRRQWMPADAEAMRLVFSESDGLPGLIVDRYADTVVIQCSTAPWESRRDALVEALVALLNPRTVYERSDLDVRRHEELEPRQGLLWGAAPPESGVPFSENGCRFLADVIHGHKTGFYLDQSANRQRAAAWVRRLGAPRVLNVFAYTDAFGIAALAAGAREVVAVDSALKAQPLAAAQLALNPGCDPARHRTIVGDAFSALRELHQAGELFDLVILDPPRLVTRKDRMQEGLRAYKDANLFAIKLTRPGGVLLTFSCSGLVERELFTKVLEGAVRDSGREAQLIETLDAPPDHPRRLGFPESDYLKGAVLGIA